MGAIRFRTYTAQTIQAFDVVTFKMGLIRLISGPDVTTESVCLYILLRQVILRTKFGM